MTADQAQCAQRESATCFSTADVESGDVDNYCFPQAATCEHYEERARETTKYAKACETYQ